MINRHNYEEYFLLYADDELNHQQRAAVELFVQQNPDMAAELEMIGQMKLEPEDNIVFPDKGMLYKTTDVDINIRNYEEYFLLYIDKELDRATSDKVEKFVLQHPQLQQEFTLLKQTVLQPEAITFADKSVLYRKEERRVAYLGFARLAAAAAFIGLALLGWWMYPKTTVKGGDGSIAVIKPLTKHTTPAVELTQKTITDIPVTLQGKKDVAVASGVKKISPAKTTETVKKAGNGVQKLPVTPLTVEHNDVALNPIKQNNNEQATATITTNPTPGDNGTNVGTVVQDHPLARLTEMPTGMTTKTDPRQGKNAEDPFVSQPNTAASVAQTVAYKEIDTNEDEHSMYVGSLELNKDKIKGFFKRAGRLFGARPKKDTD